MKAEKNLNVAVTFFDTLLTYSDVEVVGIVHAAEPENIPLPRRKYGHSAFSMLSPDEHYTYAHN